MARRFFSAAVMVRKAPTQAQRDLALLQGQSLTVSMPTNSEMRDALARLISELETMRRARTAGGSEWEVEDGSFDPRVNVTAEGEITLRGGIIIARPD